jgi:hypothetical protein
MRSFKSGTGKFLNFNTFLQLLEALLASEGSSQATVKSKIECARLEWQQSKHEGTIHLFK